MHTVKMLNTRKVVEDRFMGKPEAGIMAEYVRGFFRETEPAEYWRTKTHLNLLF